MNHKLPGKMNQIPASQYNRVQIIMLLFPVLLVLFWFRENISEWLVYTFFRLPSGKLFSGSLAFFTATCLKIFILLMTIIFIMSFIRTWIPTEKIRKRLVSLPPLLANFIAGIFGVVSPFCSCSAVPVFISFLEAGVPLGITISFLVASPIVNEVIIIMLLSLFGWKISLIYIGAGLIIAVVSGFVIDLLKLERYLPLWILDFRNDKKMSGHDFTLTDRTDSAFEAVKDVFGRTWVYIVAGIAAGSVIHGYIPESFLTGIPGSNSWYTLPLVILTGIPLYACSAAVAPVAFALVDKGMPVGIALAFIMSVAGLSLPEFIMLKKILSLRLILIFTGIVFTGILIIGYFFNLIL